MAGAGAAPGVDLRGEVGQGWLQTPAEGAGAEGRSRAGLAGAVDVGAPGARAGAGAQGRRWGPGASGAERRAGGAPDARGRPARGQRLVAGRRLGPRGPAVALVGPGRRAGRRLELGRAPRRRAAEAGLSQGPAPEVRPVAPAARSPGVPGHGHSGPTPVRGERSGSGEAGLGRTTEGWGQEPIQVIFLTKGSQARHILTPRPLPLPHRGTSRPRRFQSRPNAARVVSLPEGERGFHICLEAPRVGLHPAPPVRAPTTRTTDDGPGPVCEPRVPVWSERDGEGPSG